MPNALHRLQMRLVFAAIFALLFAQLGALAHGYSHDAVAQSRTAPQSGVGNHETCTDCIAYAGVLSAAGSAADALCFAPELPVVTVSFGYDSLRDDCSVLAFHSRAPPVTR